MPLELSRAWCHVHLPGEPVPVSNQTLGYLFLMSSLNFLWLSFTPFPHGPSLVTREGRSAPPTTSLPANLLKCSHFQIWLHAGTFCLASLWLYYHRASQVTLVSSVEVSCDWCQEITFGHHAGLSYSRPGPLRKKLPSLTHKLLPESHIHPVSDRGFSLVALGGKKFYRVPYQIIEYNLL